MAYDGTVTSPFLRRRAREDVDWHPWSAEAFAVAARRDTPLCVWSGSSVDPEAVSPDDAAVRDALARYVAVAVDRVERPDVDAVLGAAAVALTGRGGWPIVCLLTPAGRPFFAAAGLTGEALAHLLVSAAEAWEERREEVVEAADRITEGLHTQVDAAVGAREVDEIDPVAALDAAEDQVAELVDWSTGAFGRPPVFAPSMTLTWLLAHHRRTGTPRALQVAQVVGQAMADGAMRDPVTGGFARFATSAPWGDPVPRWTLPDNALALAFYAALAEADGADWVRRVVADTADFLLTHLRDGEGTFSASIDTGASGAHLWTREQLIGVLGDDGATTALLLTGDSGADAVPLRCPTTVDRAGWERVRPHLARARAARELDGGVERDPSVVAAWNGLAIAALGDAGRLLRRTDLVHAAETAAEAVLATHLVDGTLRRLSVAAVPTAAPGTAADHGLLAHGLQRLYTATGEQVWLDAAAALLETAVDLFAAPGGGFYDSAPTPGVPDVLRLRGSADVTEPGGSNAVARALLDQGRLTGEAAYLQAGRSAVAAAARSAVRTPVFAGWILTAAEEQP